MQENPLEIAGVGAFLLALILYVVWACISIAGILFAGNFLRTMGTKFVGWALTVGGWSSLGTITLAAVVQTVHVMNGRHENIAMALGCALIVFSNFTLYNHLRKKHLDV